MIASGLLADGELPWRQHRWRRRERTGIVASAPNREALEVQAGPMTQDRSAVANPDHAARFAEIVLPHLDAAYNLARWLARDAALADDIVQDAMLRAMTYFASFRGENPRAWLLQIVRNVAFDTLRSRRAMVDRELPFEQDEDGGRESLDPPDPGAGPEMTLALKQDLRQLEQAVAGLPAELRECLVLRELEQLSYKEIARIVGAPIGTVMSRLWRARRLLLVACKEGPA
jgi:RNA polymerase sigma-70 factor (ECF subfamily)